MVLHVIFWGKAALQKLFTEMCENPFEMTQMVTVFCPILGNKSMYTSSGLK